MEFVIKRTKRRIDEADEKPEVTGKIPNVLPKNLNSGIKPNKNDNEFTSTSSLNSFVVPDNLSTEKLRGSELARKHLRNLNPLNLFPKRPGIGHEGRKISIITNYFEMKIPHGLIYHYDVTIEPQKKDKDHSVVSAKKYNCLNTKLNREVIKYLLRNEFFKEYPAVFDGKKNMFTRYPMPIKEPRKFSVSVRNNYYHVILKPVCKDKIGVPCIDLEPLQEILQGKSMRISEEAIVALDTIMRHGPAQSLVPIGRSFFFTPANGECISLGGGREIWFGYHQSVRISQWKPLLNVDMSATAFYKSGPVLKFVEEVLNVDIRRVKELKDYEIRKLRKELKSLKITVNHLDYKKKYTINSVTRDSANHVHFQWAKNNSTLRISVADYFYKQYRELKYPNLPCLNVGNSSYLPLEVCDLCPAQHCRTKLDEKQIAEMIKHTARPPQTRFKDIMRAVRQTSEENERLTRQFGIKISRQPLQLNGRILMPPTIMYDQFQEIRPNNGTWDIRGKHFFHSVNLEFWAFVNLASSNICRESDMENFARMICETGRKFGMAIKRPCYLREYSPSDGSLQKMFINILNHYPIIQLIMVIVPSRGGGNLYAEVKEVAEIRMGLITQCVRDINLSGKKCNAQLICNLCQKINAKLGGVNNILSPTIKPKIFNKPIIIIGADCNHPSPHEKIKSSVAALVGSLDNHPSRYAATINVQMNSKKNRMEIIENMKDMMKDLLLAFYRNTRGQRPEKIIFYRDGLSEGEFIKAFNKELKLIRQACEEMNPAEVYEPPITFIIVGKRHHTRFIPENPENGVGKHRNVPPGTVVDTEITHPSQFDFFICSHTGIQGTSRPAHYTVLWDDNNFTADELQTLSYYLCHTYVRCTRSISIPCPVMYAHLAAYRAKQYLISRCEEMSSNSDSASSSDLSGDQSLIENSFKYAVQVDSKIRNAMYFV